MRFAATLPVPVVAEEVHRAQTNPAQAGSDLVDAFAAVVRGLSLAVLALPISAGWGGPATRGDTAVVRAGAVR